MKKHSKTFLYLFLLLNFSKAHAATAIPFTITMSEAVNVAGCPANCPRITLDVDGVTRYAEYTSGTGTSSLTFTYNAQTGDVDLDGISLSSPLDLNGGTVTDLNGNPQTNLAFTVPDTSGVRIDYPSLSMNFIADADGRYALNGTIYNDLPALISATGGSFTRNSVGTYFDENGVMQTASANQPRFDHDPVTHTPKGMLIEGLKINSIPNSSMSGAAIGNLPTGWSYQNVAGITASVTGTGTENGIPYIDLRISGTPGASGTFALFMTPAATIAASNGQTWNFSLYKKLSGGNTTNLLNILIGTQIYSSSPAYLGGAGNQIFTPTAANLETQRVTFSGTISNASTAYIRPFFAATVTNGQSVDMTLRLGAPQLEQNSFATSYIPTTNAAVTRNSDSLIIPTGSWFNNTQGTLWAQTINGVTSSTVGIISIDGSSLPADERITLIRTGINNIESQVRTIAGTQYLNTLSANGNNSSNKMAMSYAANNFLLSVNNTLGPLDTAGNLPSVNRLRLGVWSASAYYYGWISAFKYYPRRINSTQLTLVTQ